VQRLFGLAARGERGAGDGLLLSEGALAQGAGEAGGDGVLQPGAASLALLGGQGGVRPAIEHEVRVDDSEGAGERVRVGAVCLDERGPDPLGGCRVEVAGAQGGAQLFGEWE
jgi:hypothetical protein